MLQSKPIRSRKATTPLRGRIVPEMQVLKVCKQHAGLALALRVRSSQSRGSEDLAVEFHIFRVFLNPRATIPPQKQGVSI